MFSVSKTLYERDAKIAGKAGLRGQKGREKENYTKLVCLILS